MIISVGSVFVVSNEGFLIVIGECTKYEYSLVTTNC